MTTNIFLPAVKSASQRPSTTMQRSALAPEELKVLNQARQQILQLTNSIQNLQQDVLRNNPFPPWSVLLSTLPYPLPDTSNPAPRRPPINLQIQPLSITNLRRQGILPSLCGNHRAKRPDSDNSPRPSFRLTRTNGRLPIDELSWPHRGGYSRASPAEEAGATGPDLGRGRKRHCH